MFGAANAFAADAAVQSAVIDLQHQNYKSAEQKLRAEVKLHPSDAETLSLLGVALDEQQKFTEARDFHKRAVANAPNSTAALYNYANNLLATGDEKAARDVLMKAVAVNPADRNSNVALAQIAVNQKNGAEALTYLNRLPDGPDIAIVKLAALDLTGQHDQANALFTQISNATQNDARTSEAAAQMLSKAGQFEQAETFLTHALAVEPSNFQIMYSLGVAASQAGHNDRAKTVLEAALRQKPQDVNTLYALAVVEDAMSQPDAAIRLLAEAARLDPARADVQKLTAITARNLKADEDSVAAWDRYLKLVPDDDEAKRERAFAKARLALLDEALPELQGYVTRHPKDAMGFYELGMAQSVDDPAKAIESLNRAVVLNPDLVVARAGRGTLLYTQDQPEAAVTDLQFALSKIPAGAPERGPILDRLGQALVALNRVNDALPPLREAAQSSPDDATTQLHLANALAEAGQTEESEKLMAHFQAMNPGGRTTKVTGVVDYLSMSPAERHDLYRTRLEKAVHDHPDDSKTRILYLKLLLSDNRMAEAAVEARAIAALKPGVVALAEAGRALNEARQYGVAKEVLQAAAGSPEAEIDLAVATFHADGGNTAAADAGLRVLDTIPENRRDAGYFAARAQMLDAGLKPDEAIAAINDALRLDPASADLYWQAAALMTKNHRTDEALQLLDRGAKTLPQESEIAVTRAMVLDLSGKTDDATRVLSDAQRRWPEVASVWTARGALLDEHRQPDAARKAFAAAAALGARTAQSADPEKLLLSAPPREW